MVGNARVAPTENHDPRLEPGINYLSEGTQSRNRNVISNHGPFTLNDNLSYYLLHCYNCDNISFRKKIASLEKRFHFINSDNIAFAKKDF